MCFEARFAMLIVIIDAMAPEMMIVIRIVIKVSMLSEGRSWLIATAAPVLVF